MGSILEILKQDGQITDFQHVTPQSEVENLESAPETDADFGIFKKEPEIKEPERPVFQQNRAEAPEIEVDNGQTDNAIIRAEAKMTTSVLSMSISRISSAIGQQPIEKYQISKEEKIEFNEVLINYMIVTGFRPNIHIEFWLAVSAVFGTKLIIAFQDRQAANIARKKIKGNKLTNDGYSEVHEMPAKRDRKRFKIDVDNFYQFDEAGNYLAKAERREKPIPEILILIKEYEKQQLSEGEINKRLIEHLQGDAKPQ